MSADFLLSLPRPFYHDFYLLFLCRPILKLIVDTAYDIGVDVDHVDRVELNHITGNQAHQGVALRASGLQPTQLTSLTQYNQGR